MKNKYLLATLIIFAVILSATALFVTTEKDHIAVMTAEKMMQNGDYDRAREIYEKIGDTRRADECMELIKARTYSRAELLLQTGDYAGVRTLLAEIPEYDGVQNLLDCCDWQEAQALADAGQYSDARALFLRIEDYPGAADSIEKMNALLYDEAHELANSFELQEAGEIWQDLGTYRNAKLLAARCREIQSWTAPGEKSIMDELVFYSSGNYVSVYACDIGYFVIPKECREDTGFVLYYPGGKNEELYIDYFLCYLENPARNAIALFLNRNGLYGMEEKNTAALEKLERVAAAQGLFVHDLVVCGSSLGAYPAMHSAVYSYRERGIYVPCVLSLDAGDDWSDPSLVLDENECREAAELGTVFYLYESPWVGTDRKPIRRMVNAGDNVVLVGCVYDDHTRITMDALGMGAFAWALGDRTEPHRTDIYSYTKLEP